MLDIEKSLNQVIDDHKRSDLIGDARAKARSRFREVGLPGRKHEEWKYTNIGGMIPNGLKLADEVNPSDLDLYDFEIDGLEAKCSCVFERKVCFGVL